MTAIKKIWTIIEGLFQPVFEELVGGCVWQHSGEATPASKSHSYFFVDKKQKYFKGQLFVYRRKDLGANNHSTETLFSSRRLSLRVLRSEVDSRRS